MKTVMEYMNDPRILNDPSMIGALEPIRTIHAIRLKMQDETRGMSSAERSAIHKKNATEFFTSLGLPPPKYVDLSGQGKIKARAAVGSV